MTALKSFGQSWNSVRPLFRVDRIPILSFLFGRREFWTELELCPPVSLLIRGSVTKAEETGLLGIAVYD